MNYNIAVIFRWSHTFMSFYNWYPRGRVSTDYSCCSVGVIYFIVRPAWYRCRGGSMTNQLRSATICRGRWTAKRWPQNFTSVANYDNSWTAAIDANDGHVDRMKVTFILAAISTGNAALTTAPVGGGKRTRLVNSWSAVSCPRTGRLWIIVTYTTLYDYSF